MYVPFVFMQHSVKIISHPFYDSAFQHCHVNKPDVNLFHNVVNV